MFILEGLLVEEIHDPTGRHGTRLPRPLPMTGEAVRLLRIDDDVEREMVYLARQSAPANWDKDHAGLLRYCMAHGHWSVFDMAVVKWEIVTSRDISAQIIRHKSFYVQEYSFRYAAACSFVGTNPREQGGSSRQSSTDTLGAAGAVRFKEIESEVVSDCMRAYDAAVALGVPREQARRLIPLSATTKLAVMTTVRSLIHYIRVRAAEDTQEEHQFIAFAMGELASEFLPLISEIEGWKKRRSSQSDLPYTVSRNVPILPYRREK